MVSLPKPEVICTHESDLDGFVAGLLLQRLASQLFGNSPKLQAYHNHNWKQRPISERAAWVADLTFDSRLDKAGWTIIDHHTTDIKPRNAQLIHDTSKSASLLVYELCQSHGISSPELDRIVHWTNVNDLFLDDDPEFGLAHDYGNLVKIYQFWNLWELIQGRLENLIDHPLLEVMAVKRRIENPLGYAWSRQHVTRISDQVGFVDSIVGNVNMIVHQLLEEQAVNYPVLMTLFRKGNGTMIASFRSRNGEAIKVAEKLQGGGHANASGATLPRSVQNVSDAIAFLQNAFNPAPRQGADFNSLESAFSAIEQL
ncbi:MAG: DHHA1 domain-containing protein [Verrucomicrobiota bacterium]|nr:DHHA1 domain-containing protein [Verrucomicrobiota bacterium]